MGVCESGNNTKETNIPSGISHAKHLPRDETILNGQLPIEIDPYVANVSKSLCFIQTQSSSGSGFLIKLFKGTQDFFCLITCEHVIKREMVNQRQTINFFYDSLNAKQKEIILNLDERLIQDFRESNELICNIDAIVIEILPEDNITEEYFLLPDIRSIYNFVNLENQEIAIIQYPKGKLSYAYGKIKEVYINKYEFSHSASTNYGSSGSPIFLKDSIQVIGIHKGGDSYENYGEFIGPIFEYFQNFTEKKEPWNKYLINKNDIKDKSNIINKNKKRKSININIPNNIPINQLNQMTIIYNIDKEFITIFGTTFVRNNKYNCYLIINGEQRELCDYLIKSKIKIENNQLKIKLIEIKHITNMSWMFCNCRSLVSLPDISKWNTANVINMSRMFYNCSSLKSFPDISKWKLNKLIYKYDMFKGCNERIIPEKFKSNCLIY